MPKSCDDCTLCCRLLGVPEIKKPIGVDCKHCSASAPHCRIYRRRPKQCRDFECGWLLSELPDAFRPDRSHILITGEDHIRRCHVLHVDPQYPEAPDTPIGRALIRLIQVAGYPTVVVVTAGKHRIFDEDYSRVLALEALFADLTAPMMPAPPINKTPQRKP